MIKRLSIKEYYTAPSNEIFEDIKQASIKLWNTYDNTYGYATEKIDRIKDIGNLQDNYAYMVAMFDIFNQMKLYSLVEREDTKEMILSLLETSKPEVE